MNKSKHIIVVENSPMVSEGLSGILHKSGLHCQISFTLSHEEMELLLAKSHCDLVIVNPAFILNHTKSFHAIRSKFGSIKWIGLVYAHYDPKLLALFDGIITISDTSESIVGSIQRLLAAENQQGQSSSQEILSEREVDVLKLVATGMSNKEIADKLNISINTVITHRKNISQKTGIKSVSGLTIFAVVQKLVSIESLSL